MLRQKYSYRKEIEISKNQKSKKAKKKKRIKKKN